MRQVPDASLGSILGERADVIAKGLWDIGGTVQSRVSDFRVRNIIILLLSFLFVIY